MNRLTINAAITNNCCNYYNKMNNKLEQGRIENIVVTFTSIKLNKSIAFFTKVCYAENSRDD